MRFKIGDFARVARVSLKTLHHYDDIGLLKPDWVDPFTGYRFYRLAQLPRLNRILALRDLGFSLEAIRPLLADGLPPEALRALLHQREAQLQQQVAEAEARLAQVALRLRWIEQEGTMAEMDVLLKTVAPLTVVGAREVVAVPEAMRERCMALNDAACALIEAAQLKSDGVSLALYHNSPTPGIDVEMAYVVEAPAGEVPGVAPATLHPLPACEVAYAVYHGSYNDFAAVGQMHAAICQWIEAHGYQVAGAAREYYLQPPREWEHPIGVMEIQYPVARARVG